MNTFLIGIKKNMKRVKIEIWKKSEYLYSIQEILINLCILYLKNHLSLLKYFINNERTKQIFFLHL